MCCYDPCDQIAQFEIRTNQEPETTYTCEAHVGPMLEDGTSTVWPIQPSEAP